MQLLELWLRDSRVCSLCLDEVPLSEASRDHIVPRSVARNNAADNLALAHVACNNLRSDKPRESRSVEQYREYRRAWLVRPEKVRLPKPKVASQPPLAREPRWRCNFCGSANDSKWVKPSGEVRYRLCRNEACRARQYDPIGFSI